VSGLILPGATIGVLGSGQLGRMFAIAARRMGYRVATYSPGEDTPTGQVADIEVVGAYDDLDAVSAFAKRVSVVTFEFENVPASTAEAAAAQTPVRPSGSVLHTTQQRLREKTFLQQHGFPVTPFQFVRSLDELNQALAKLGCPAILKTAGWGYDGKGQVRINSLDESAAAWKFVGTTEAVLEAFVDFDCELSVVAARGLRDARGPQTGHEFASYGAILNSHQHHILDTSVAPGPFPQNLQDEADEIARGILEALDVVGVLCVEFFLTRSRKLLVNELAPRPHNSGHLTFDACVTSQFEQQLRAICGLPLGSTQLLRPAAMANLLGELWEGHEPYWEKACAFPEVKLHLYGKLDAKPGRKMGHLTALADSAAAALTLVQSARRALTTADP